MTIVPKFHSLNDLDAVTIARYQADPVAFIEENLISPYDGKPYRLVPAERTFIKHIFEFDADGRLKFPLWIFGAIKKSRKSELSQLLTITAIILFGGKYAEVFLIANDLQQAIDRGLTTCKRIIDASPLLRNEFTTTQDKIVLTATQSVIRAIPCDPSGVAGAHPVLSVFDEFRTATDRVEKMYHELIPVPSRKFSARLIVSHAGHDEGLLYDLYKRGVQQPLVGENLYVGDGLCMHWSHVPLHSWQNDKWLLEMRRELPASDYLCMGENKFVPSTAEFITGDEWDRIITLSKPPVPNPSWQVFAAVDIGIKRDSTAIITVRGEQDNVCLVEDKILVPSPGEPINLAVVEQYLLDLKKRYPLLTIVYDPREMEFMAQRLRSLGLRVIEFTQNPQNLSSMTQCLFDLVKYRRLQVYPNEKLRYAIMHTVVAEKSDGHRLIRSNDQTDHVDAVVALAMGALACVQRFTKHVDLVHKYRAFASDFRDENLPPLPPPTPASAFDNSVFAGSWWKLSQPATYVEDANEQLKRFYKSLNGGY